VLGDSCRGMRTRTMGVLSSGRGVLLLLYTLARPHSLLRSTLWTTQHCKAAQLICRNRPLNMGRCVYSTHRRSRGVAACFLLYTGWAD
jgi:hypothetical protein